METVAKFVDAVADLRDAAIKSPRAFFMVAVIFLAVGYGIGAWYYGGRVADAEASPEHTLGLELSKSR